MSVAPMMDWTDRHCRYFLRGFSPRVLLYSEMITAAAILRGDRARLLRFSAEEHPVALQLGGSEPVQLALAARAGEDASYDEINLNCGCPSDRVHAGAFGACLMANPALVAECVAAMRAAVRIPVTVKMRIGIVQHTRGALDREALRAFDEADYARLRDFTTAVAAAGCEHVIVHARKAVLGGLSPRENREVPPLHHDVVTRLKRDLPALWIGVNGGLRTAQHCAQVLDWADGVMLGREAYHHPQVLAQLHAAVFDDGWCCPDTAALLERMAAYASRELESGERLSSITRHLLGLANGQHGARRYRQLLSEGVRAIGEPASPQAARLLLRTAASSLTAA